jgi:hypothetical protein
MGRGDEWSSMKRVLMRILLEEREILLGILQTWEAREQLIDKLEDIAGDDEEVAQLVSSGRAVRQELKAFLLRSLLHSA